MSDPYEVEREEDDLLDDLDEEEDYEICAICQGSGEGSHEGATCTYCGGVGEVYVGD